MDDIIYEKDLEIDPTMLKRLKRILQKVCFRPTEHHKKLLSTSLMLNPANKESFGVTNLELMDEVQGPLNKAPLLSNLAMEHYKISMSKVIGLYHQSNR